MRHADSYMQDGVGCAPPPSCRLVYVGRGRLWPYLLHQLCKQGFKQLLAEPGAAFYRPALVSHTPRMNSRG